MLLKNMILDWIPVNFNKKEKSTSYFSPTPNLISFVKAPIYILQSIF